MVTLLSSPLMQITFSFPKSNERTVEQFSLWSSSAGPWTLLRKKDAHGKLANLSTIWLFFHKMFILQYVFTIVAPPSRQGRSNSNPKVGREKIALIPAENTGAPAQSPSQDTFCGSPPEALTSPFALI